MMKLGYINILGLNESKFQSCISFLDSGLFDILFLAEHWFVRNFSYRQHPYCIAESSFDPSFVRTGAHTQGGILVMAHPRVSNLIQSFSCSVHYIVLRITSINILAVYFPPSLIGSQLQATLATLPPTDVLVGDINCRFDGIAASRRYSPVPLQECWNRFRRDTGLRSTQLISVPPYLPPDVIQIMLRSQSNHLQDAVDEILLREIHHIPLSQSFELDHIFVHPRLYDRLKTFLYTTEFFQFKTDHQYIIAFEIQTTSHADVHDPESITGRYRIKRLSDKKTMDLFRRRWSELSDELRHTYFQCVDVDLVNDSLTSMVGDLSKEVLGMYQVQQTKTTNDIHAQQLTKSLTSVAAIQLFKRHMRSQTNRHRIVAIDKDGDVMQECVERFTAQFYDPSIASDIRYKDPIRLHSKNDLFSLLTIESLKEFIESYPLDKACGYDSIHTLILRALLPTTFPEFLLHLFIQCVNTVKTPRNWNRSVVYLLPKSKEKPPDAKTVRPISILPMFRRIFESLLIPIFTDFKYRYARLHPCQAGFRRGYSTLTNVAVCHHLLANRLATVAIFLDFRAAYDVIKPDRVVAALQRRKTPEYLIQLVLSLMFSASDFTLIVNGLPSARLERNQGLPQGSPLSPILFNLFIDSLVRRLNTKSTSIPSCLFYADDGVLFAKEEREMRRLLNIAEDWSIAEKMTYNVSKCGVLQQPATVAEYTLCGSNIPIVPTYKYLGFPMTVDGLDYITHLQTLADTVLGFLKFIQFDSSIWSCNTRWIIYRTFIRPQMEYGAPLIHCFKISTKDSKFYTSMDLVEKESIAWVLSSQTRIHNTNRCVLGALPVDERFSHLRTMFEEHLSTLNSDNPLRKLLDSGIKFTSKELLFHLSKDKRYQEYLRAVDEPSPVALRSHLLSLRQEFIYRKGGILIGYISKESRTRSLVDCTLSAPADSQRMFLSWRTGRFLLRSKCLCGEQWNRQHFKCFPDQIYRLTPKLRQKWEGIISERNDKMTVVDFLLNEKQWYLASIILSEYRSLLRMEEEEDVDQEVLSAMTF